MRDTGGEGEFIRLLQQHQGILHKVCRVYCRQAADQQDLLQEITVQAWKSYTNFRGDAKFSTWLYRVALNTAITALRRRKRNIEMPSPGWLPESPDIQYSGESDEQLEILYGAIDRLTELEKAIVMLYLDDRSYEEMEEIFGINQNNLRVKMNRIKDKLRKLTGK